MMELIAKKWNKGRNRNLSHFRDSSYFKTAAELIQVSDVPILWHVLQRKAPIRVIQVVLKAFPEGVKFWDPFDYRQTALHITVTGYRDTRRESTEIVSAIFDAYSVA